MSAGTETNRWNAPGTAIAVMAAAALSEEARSRLKAEQSPKEFVAALVAAGLNADAMKAIPHALTKAEAIWWSAQCVRFVPALVTDPNAVSAIAAAEKWCASPSDEYRRAAMAASEVVGLASPSGCVAMAVFLSEGSLAPVTVAHVVPPPPSLGQGLAGNAALLAAVAKNPEKAGEKFAAFVQLAHDVASGKNRWPGGTPATSSATVPAAAKPPAVPGPKEFPPFPQPKR